MEKPGTWKVVSGAAAIVVLAACGGSSTSTKQVRISSPFTEQHAEIFEDGIDFVADPEKLEGRWQDNWTESLRRRVRAADLIATVTVNTVRTDVDLEKQSTYRLLADVQNRLLGESPDELMLTVQEGQKGFGTVKGNDQRILNQPFVAFVKWYRTDQGSAAPHWHLAPASEPVIGRVKRLITKRKENGEEEQEGESRRVIVRGQ